MDPYGGLQNPNYLELQQKNVAAGENCPYASTPETYYNNNNSNNLFSLKW